MGAGTKSAPVPIRDKPATTERGPTVTERDPTVTERDPMATEHGRETIARPATDPRAVVAPMVATSPTAASQAAHPEAADPTATDPRASARLDGPTTARAMTDPSMPGVVTGQVPTDDPTMGRHDMTGELTSASAIALAARVHPGAPGIATATPDRAAGAATGTGPTATGPGHPAHRLRPRGSVRAKRSSPADVLWRRRLQLVGRPGACW